jgi:hypothetical protein
MVAEDVQAVSIRLHHFARMYSWWRRRICLISFLIMKLHRRSSKMRRKKGKRRSCLLRISEAVTTSSPNIWNRSNSPSIPKS